MLSPWLRALALGLIPALHLDTAAAVVLQSPCLLPAAFIQTALLHAAVPPALTSRFSVDATRTTHAIQGRLLGSVTPAQPAKAPILIFGLPTVSSAEIALVITSLLFAGVTIWVVWRRAIPAFKIWQERRAAAGKEKRQKKRASLEESTGQMRRTFFSWSALAGGSAVVAAWSGFRFWDRPPENSRFQTPLGVFEAWASVILRQTRPQEVMDQTSAIRDPQHRAWAESVQAHFLKLFPHLDKKGPVAAMSREWKLAYQRLIEEMNDLAVPKNLLLIADFNEPAGFALATITLKQTLEVTHAAPEGTFTHQVPHYAGLIVELAPRAPGRASSVYFGRYERPVIFSNLAIVEAHHARLQGLLDPHSSISKEFLAHGNERARRGFLTALEKDGWLRDGRLREGFEQAFEHEILNHEIGHFLNNKGNRFWGNQDETFQLIKDVSGPFSHTMLMETLFTAQNQANDYRAAGSSFFDPTKIVDETATQIAIAYMFAIAAGQLDLVGRIQKLERESFLDLHERLFGLDSKVLTAIPGRVMKSVDRDMPAQGTWDFRVLTSQRVAGAPPHAPNRPSIRRNVLLIPA